MRKAATTTSRTGPSASQVRSWNGWRRDADRSAGLRADRGAATRHPAFTLLELLLVVAILALLAGMVGPRLWGELESARMPESANQMRALIQFARTNAMIDGRRYRLRFPRSDELDGQGESRQPIVETERDPLQEPGVYTPVLASWAQDVTLQQDVRCVQVRLGKPTVELLLGEVDKQEVEDAERRLEQAAGESFERGLPPLIIEPDGTCDWATFVLTDAPLQVDYEDLTADGYAQLEVILDGVSGLAWIQRALYQEELEMMREHGWPPVLRRDFTEKTALTEDDVLEIREESVRR